MAASMPWPMARITLTHRPHTPQPPRDPPSDKGRHLELRHQRNPDVVFDCLTESQGGAEGGREGSCPTCPLPGKDPVARISAGSSQHSRLSVVCAVRGEGEEGGGRASGSRSLPVLQGARTSPCQPRPSLHACSSHHTSMLSSNPLSLALPLEQAQDGGCRPPCTTPWRRCCPTPRAGSWSCGHERGCPAAPAGSRWRSRRRGCEATRPRRRSVRAREQRPGCCWARVTAYHRTGSRVGAMQGERAVAWTVGPCRGGRGKGPLRWVGRAVR